MEMMLRSVSSITSTLALRKNSARELPGGWLRLWELVFPDSQEAQRKSVDVHPMHHPGDLPIDRENFEDCLKGILELRVRLDNFSVGMQRPPTPITPRRCILLNTIKHPPKLRLLLHQVLTYLRDTEDAEVRHTPSEMDDCFAHFPKCPRYVDVSGFDMVADGANIA